MEARRRTRDPGARLEGHRAMAIEIQAPSPAWLRFFAWQARRQIRGQFHALRRVRGERPAALERGPLVIYSNHPAWWDPLVCFHLARTLLPDRQHHAPIEARALERYAFFRKLGFFGVELEGYRGAARFLSHAEAILRLPNTALWVTPQGAFRDPRDRPAELRPGIAHLARRLEHATFLPLAIEYPFWEERLPEALVSFGQPLYVERGRDRGAREWGEQLAHILEGTQDELARHARARDAAAFEVLLRGRRGIGGIYDRWRSLRARWRGETFDPGHGAPA